MSKAERLFKMEKFQLPIRERRDGDYGVRLLDDEECGNLSADQLRTMIDEANSDGNEMVQ
jgi:hypothetical protein